MIIMKIAIVRGAFLNAWEMQNFAPLEKKPNIAITIFGAKRILSVPQDLPIKRLWSPLDLPNFPAKMQFLNRLLGDAHYLYGLEKALKGYDIAHCAETYYYYTYQCLRAKQRGWVKKVVSTVWETIPFNNEAIRRRKAFKQMAYKNVDFFLVPTKRAKRALLAEGVDEKKIKQQFYGVDLNHFHPSNRNNDGNRLLFVGRLVAEKGIWEVLQAFSLLIQQNKYFRLIIVGDGREKLTILNWLRKKGLKPYVRLLSSQPYEEMAKIYRMADIFLLPSRPGYCWEEQYGMAVVEAMASGLPVIVSSSGAMAEVVATAGIVIPPANVRALVKMIAKLKRNNQYRWRLGYLARRRAERYFDHKLIARNILRLYQSLLKN